MFMKLAEWLRCSSITEAKELGILLFYKKWLDDLKYLASSGCYYNLIKFIMYFTNTVSWGAVKPSLWKSIVTGSFKTVV